MNELALFIVLVLGGVAGYRLFPVAASLRKWLRRRFFKPVLLQRYRPNKLPGQD